MSIEYYSCSGAQALYNMYNNGSFKTREKVPVPSFSVKPPRWAPSSIIYFLAFFGAFLGAFLGPFSG